MHTIALGALLFSAIFQPAPPPSQPSVDVRCDGGILYWSSTPGLTTAKTRHRFAATGDLGTCDSASRPDITGGQVFLEGYGGGGCPIGVTAGSSRVSIVWNTGEKSQAQGSFHATPEGYGMAAGTVLSGPFQGGGATVLAQVGQDVWAACGKDVAATHGEAALGTVQIVRSSGS